MLKIENINSRTSEISFSVKCQTLMVKCHRSIEEGSNWRMSLDKRHGFNVNGEPLEPKRQRSNIASYTEREKPNLKLSNQVLAQYLKVEDSYKL